MKHFHGVDKLLYMLMWWSWAVLPIACYHMVLSMNLAYIVVNSGWSRPSQSCLSTLLSIGALALCHLVPLYQSYSATDCDVTLLLIAKSQCYALLYTTRATMDINYATLAKCFACESLIVLVLMGMSHEHMLSWFVKDFVPA